MWTPATAVLWECWRVSRLLLASVMFLAMLVGAGLNALPIDDERVATLLVVWAFYFAVFGQLWTLNIDSRTGFTLRLGFTRPIPTWVLVTVPMVYVAASSAVTYIVPILFLRTALGIPLPLLPAALASTVCLTWVAFSWSSANPVRRRAFAAILWLIAMIWIMSNLSEAGGPPTTGVAETFTFSTAGYGWMALFSAAAFWVTIAGVARQRRGDDGFAPIQPTREDAVARPRNAFRAWIADRLGVKCPVSSPERAQLWFEVSTAGGHVLTTGILTALAAPIFFTILSANGMLGEAVYFWVWFPLMVPVLVALPSMLGLRQKQGASYLDAFAATRPMGTARLVGLKVLVTSLALLLSWVVLVAGLWILAVELAVWGPETQAAFAEYFGDFFPSWPGTADGMRMIVAVVVLFTAGVAGAGVLHACFVLNGKRVGFTGLGLGIYIASCVFLSIRGWVDGYTIWVVHAWTVPGIVLLGTVYLLRRLIAERIFTSRGFIVVLGTWVGFALLSRWVNPEPNDSFHDRPVFFLFALLPLAAAALAPWSFSRLRHR